MKNVHTSFMDLSGTTSSMPTVTAGARERSSYAISSADLKAMTISFDTPGAGGCFRVRFGQTSSSSPYCLLAVPVTNIAGSATLWNLPIRAIECGSVLWQCPCTYNLPFSSRGTCQRTERIRMKLQPCNGQ